MKRIGYGQLLAIGILLVILTSVSGWAQDAQDPVISWDVIGTGGESTVGDGTYTLSFTLGQSIIGPADAGDMSVQQGFWVPVASVSGVDILRSVDGNMVVSGYPNPFNESTEIACELQRSSYVRIRIFDMLGREVRRLMDAGQSAGRLVVPWDGDDEAGIAVPSGSYLCRVELQSDPTTTGAATAHVLMLQVRR